jgi:hypothetical protein
MPYMNVFRRIRIAVSSQLMQPTIAADPQAGHGFA